MLTQIRHGQLSSFIYNMEK